MAACLVALLVKARYQAIAAKAGVPRFFIAMERQRESSQDWRAQPGAGDPWNRKSIHVPEG